MANETKKSLVEEALLQMKNLEEAVTENAKGILASTMKEEISELVKESLSEEEKVDAVGMEEGSNMGKESEMAEQEMELDIEDEVEDEMDLLGMDMDSDESELEMNMDDEEMDMDDVEDMLDMDLPGDEMEVDGEEEILIPLDLTGASDEEIMKVFKAMGEEDGIIISQDGDEVTLKDDEADVEYKIQMESEEDMGFEDEEEEIVYEIEVEDEDEDEDEEGYEEEEMAEGYNDYIDDSLGARNGKKKQSFSDRRKESEGMEKAMGKKKYSGDKSMDEMEDGEATEGMVRSHAAGQKGSSQKSKGLPKPKSIPNRARYNESTEKEIQQLREKNEEYRKALNIFKEKLNEVAVFNSNLAYATRLFTENTTTKQEKINILRRFDSVETLKESKGLYKTFKEEFEGKSANTISESMSEKVSKSPSKGSSSNLIESKTYENPQFMRMKDLMSKIIK
tara:strand:- start:1079 stop:2431 length:1353 start_codon:yes stop_codon:yes gene_type:complete